MNHRISKQDKVAKYLQQNPDVTPKQVSVKFKCSEGTFYAARKQLVYGNAKSVANNGDSLEKLHRDIEALQAIGLERVKNIIELLG